MGNVRVRIRVDHDAGTEHVIGIEQGFQVAHDGIGFVAPFGRDERRGVAAGAMFGFECAVIFAAYHPDEIVHEGSEARNL